MWARFQRLNKDPSNATSSFVKAYLISMYPPEVRGALANMTFANNEEMAEAADKYLENSRKRPGEINAVVNEPVQEDAAQVDAISKGPNRASRGQPKPGGQRSTGKTCFFHERFGPEAFKCNGAPCPFANAPLAKRSGNATAGR